MQALVECVPNISEGKNTKLIDSIAQSIRQVQGVQLIHIDSGVAVNRSVFTFVGTPEAVVEAAFAMTKTACENIDMQQHKGEHPRMGVVDVCPFIPLLNYSIQETVALSINFAKKISQELHIPVYLYEHSQQLVYRKRLEQIRKGGYENLQAKMKNAEWQADFGVEFNPKTGASIVGARELLLAYNINLDTQNLDIAKDIATKIRSSGGKLITNKIHPFVSKGLLPNCKAIAWYVKDFDKIQISTNLTNYKNTSMFDVFECVTQNAKEYGVAVSGSELIGMISMEALLWTTQQIIQKKNLESDAFSTQDHIHLFESYFNLHDCYSIVMKEKILDTYFNAVQS